jgi:hypothetical protein
LVELGAVLLVKLIVPNKVCQCISALSQWVYDIEIVKQDLFRVTV